MARIAAEVRDAPIRRFRENADQDDGPEAEPAAWPPVDTGVWTLAQSEFAASGW
jgi:hypothetical protein